MYSIIFASKSDNARKKKDYFIDKVYFVNLKNLFIFLERRNL